MTTRSQINSNFYQIVNVDANSNPTQVKPEYITQVGNLTSLTVTGNANIGNINTGIITATGNITAPFFIGNVVGNISGNFVVPGANMDVIFNNNGNAGASTAFQFDIDNNTLTLNGPMNAQSFFGDGAGLYNITAANVSGLGNIVTVNLDGNSSNILYGNGVFATAPSVSNVANANYANFAGTAYSVSGSNVSGTVANANYAEYSNIANTANSVAVANVSGIGNIATTNYDGNASNVLYGNGGFYALPTVSNVANANYANFAGTAYSVSGSNVSGEVANANYSTYSGTASTANSVAGANVSGEVAYAAVANSVAVANVSGIGNIATLNLTGSTSNVLFGNGVFAAIPTDDANFANFAGNVTVSSQPNITSTGNLISLNINNGVSGSPTKQFQPNGVAIGSTANTNLMANSSFVDIDYGNGQGGGNVTLGKSTTYLKARGNASSLVAANVSDRVGRTNYMFYNGAANVLAVATQANPGGVGAFNANANGITTGGQYQIFTGNPNGDQNNPNALSNQNVVSIDPFGRISITQGAAGSTSAALNINTYGGTNGNANAVTQQIVFQRLRGNRDGSLSVQPNDQIGGMIFTAFNGTSQFATRTSSVTALVDNSYVANSANIPAGLRFQTVDNTTTYSHNFYANGNVVFNSNKTLTAGYFYGDGGNLTNVGIGNTLTSGQINLNVTAAGNPYLYLNGNVGNVATFNMTQGTFTVTNTDLAGGQPPFAFFIYGNNAYQEPINYSRSRGTVASPSDLVAGDYIQDQRWQVRANGSVSDAIVQATRYLGYTTGVGPYSSYSFNSTGDVANSEINFTSGNVKFNGNTFVGPGSLFNLSVYTISSLTAITGVLGQIAIVSNSGGGGNPNGMMAFWDTTNGRWSYVHDNSAV